MNVLEITIQRKTDNSWPVVAEYSRPDQLPVRSEELLNLPYSWQDELNDQAGEPKKYGTVLGRALFHGTMRDAFMKARAESKGDLRIFLVIEDDTLRSLHWERLCAPIRLGHKWDLLALDQQHPFSLYLPSLADRHFPPLGRLDLRALTLIADPPKENNYRLDWFDAAATAVSVQAGLGDIPCDILANFEGALGPPTLSELARRITGRTYTLLHIVAHGWYRAEDGETILYLLDNDGEVDPIEATQFLERLDELQGAHGLPQFFFLSTCESARPEAEAIGAMGGLAQRTVRELGIPAVLAMTEKVSIPTAQALATAFYGHLWEHGEADRALVQAAAGLRDSGDILVPALYSRLGGQALWSDTLDRPLSGAEISYGLEQMGPLLKQRAPILQSAFEEHLGKIRANRGADAAALSSESRYERQAALAAINQLCSEAVDLSFNALALGQRPPDYDARCPFPGLSAFGTRFLTTGQEEDDDRMFFFGRQALIECLQERLADHNFLPILGPSGCGKSSLVVAGLIPALQEEEPHLQMAYLTPGSHPLARLEASWSKVENKPAVLTVDQFEELFTLCKDEEERRAFLDRLLGLTGEVRVIITMRADFWGDCAPYPGLRATMQVRQELIAPMTIVELRSAMEQQAAAVGLRFEADLSNTILDAVKGEPGAMPLLQHLLHEVWKRRHGRWLRASEYRTLGGIEQAIAHTADGLYEELSAPEQDQVRDALLRLTRLDTDAIQGEERRDTRQRVAFEELVSADHDPAETSDLVQRLADARLVIISVDPVTENTEVEVAHEALIRHWPRLQQWLHEDRETLRESQGLRQAAQDWRANSEDDGYIVHRDERLGKVETLLLSSKLKLNEQELRYIRACRTLSIRELSNLARTGWGVIFGRDADPRVEEALAPLLLRRKTQATKHEKPHYHTLDYHQGESKREFLARYDVGTGTVTADKMPRYLLIVGDPESIPYSFQYELDTQFAVGRIHFDNIEEYAHYARSVVRAETAGADRPRHAVVFAPQPPDDRASDIAMRELIKPLIARLTKDMSNWQIQPVIQKDAVKSALHQALSGDRAPALLFTLSHGMALGHGAPRQFSQMGALLCQDWPGPSGWLEEWREGLPEAFCFTGDDIPENANLLGMIAFIFAEFGAGTPRTDDFAGFSFRRDRSKPIAPRAFVARLPQKLLCHSRGGALAVIGHVDKAYTSSFAGEYGELEMMVDSARQLMEGYPVGIVMERFNRRYTALASEYANRLLGVLSGDESQHRLQELALVTYDARNWVVIGDPAVRLSTSDVEPSVGGPSPSGER